MKFRRAGHRAMMYDNSHGVFIFYQVSIVSMSGNSQSSSKVYKSHDVVGNHRYNIYIVFRMSNLVITCFFMLFIYKLGAKVIFWLMWSSLI